MQSIRRELSYTDIYKSPQIPIFLSTQICRKARLSITFGSQVMIDRAIMHLLMSLWHTTYSRVLYVRICTVMQEQYPSIMRDNICALMYMLYRHSKQGLGQNNSIPFPHHMLTFPSVTTLYAILVLGMQMFEPLLYLQIPSKM